MKNLFLSVILILASNLYSQPVSNFQWLELRSTPDTIRTVTFNPFRAMFQSISIKGNLSGNDTIRVFNITENGDTVRCGVRAIGTWIDSEVIISTDSLRAREWFILSPNLNRVHLKYGNSITIPTTGKRIGATRRAITYY